MSETKKSPSRGDTGAAGAKKSASASETVLDIIEQKVDAGHFRDLTWTGTFWEYLDLVFANPRVARNAYQRAFDMILSWGAEEVVINKEKVTRYKFFDDPISGGRDAVYGLDRPLASLVGFFKAAAYHYGTEHRVLLLHGPVGSAKSTIARLLKKGLEVYSRLPEGALYTFQWKMDRGGREEWVDSPMYEEPLKLVPLEARDAVVKEVTRKRKPGDYPVLIEGHLNPFCRHTFASLMREHEGDWKKVINAHVRVRRLALSEADRVGIGTFQPKDEKNQDSTELTGDINYRKIAEYGSDSDPRAFNFDGEFNIANRG
ncbi:MAG: serine protein kinase, partial [Planctomycetes bacterium]|nr:serine protein kinase [Planctomycetota bacterium]